MHEKAVFMDEYLMHNIQTSNKADNPKIVFELQVKFIEGTFRVIS